MAESYYGYPGLNGYDTVVKIADGEAYVYCVSEGRFIKNNDCLKAKYDAGCDEFTQEQFYTILAEIVAKNFHLAIMSQNVMRALRIALQAHEGQVDKAGRSYIFHPLKVAESQQTEEATIAALLHDVVEDSSFTLDTLTAAGFSAAVIEAVKLLTHAPDVSYEDYVEAISHNDIARVVKIADLTHNLDDSRLPAPKILREAEKRAAKRQKYLASLKFLKEQK